MPSSLVNTFVYKVSVGSPPPQKKKKKKKNCSVKNGHDIERLVSLEYRIPKVE